MARQVGDREHAGLLEAHAVGHAPGLLGLGHRLLRHAAVGEDGHDPVPGTEAA